MYIYIPGSRLSSILVVEPSKTWSFPIKTRVIWVLGILYVYKYGQRPHQDLPISFFNGIYGKKMHILQNRKTVCCLVFIFKYSTLKHLKIQFV